MKSSHPRSSILDPRSAIRNPQSAMTLLPQTVLFLLVPDISGPKELSPLQILQLVGFATGAALHLYLCLMVYRRYGVRRAEIALLALGLSTGLWHLGNFAAAIHELLDVDGAWWW